MPEGVELTYSHGKVTVQGPKGKLESALSYDGEIVTDSNKIKIVPKGTSNRDRAFHGLIRSLVNNMVRGVTEGYTKTLRVVGVGYKVQLQNEALILNVGYSHPISYAIPRCIEITVPDPNTIVVSGVDKQLVGQVAADIRYFRPPEPYKGKGIMYSNETIRRKAGKTGVK